jgi:phospholipid-translocating ATPase
MLLIVFILLFQNIMTFNKCSIACKCYGDLIDEATNDVLEITEVG